MKVVNVIFFFFLVKAPSALSVLKYQNAVSLQIEGCWHHL